MKVKEIWKEVEVENKTALELVEGIIGNTMICNKQLDFTKLLELKSAIEREQAVTTARRYQLEDKYSRKCECAEEAEQRVKELEHAMAELPQPDIRMRPISELPDRVPEGCVCVLVKYACAAFENMHACTGGWQGFYILPLPKAERVLHRCYMPGCGGDAKAGINGVGNWAVRCEKCGASGPAKPTKEQAEKAWGRE